MIVDLNGIIVFSGDPFTLSNIEAVINNLLVNKKIDEVTTISSPFNYPLFYRLDDPEFIFLDTQMIANEMTQIRDFLIKDKKLEALS